MKKRTFFTGVVAVFFISLTVVNCGGDGGAPNTPTNPYPGANAKEVAVNTVLAWECTDPDGDELTYDVYLGTDQNPPGVAQGVSAPYYSPTEGLAGGTTYYWKVVAKDGSNSTGGPTWKFTTAETGGGGGGPTKTGYAYFMPLNVGNKWVYEYTETDNEGPVENDEYELLVVDKFDNYHGYESYLIKCKWLYSLPYVNYIVLGYDGDKCYLFTSPWWEYLVEDDMDWQSWSQTGFFTNYKLQFNFVRDVSVPAGQFKDCMQLGITYKYGSYTYTYEECYAKDVGFVYYQRYNDYGSSWHRYEYKLKSYTVTPP